MYKAVHYSSVVQNEKDTVLQECDVSHARCIRQEKLLREQLTQKQIDEMVMDSFPASDSPSTY